MTPGHVKAGTTKALRGTTDQRQRLYILQVPLKNQKGGLEKGDKINPKWPHQTLNTVQLTVLKRAIAEIIEKSRLVTDTAEGQTQRTGRSPLQINMLNATVSPPKRGKGINFQRIIRERKRGDGKMK